MMREFTSAASPDAEAPREYTFRLDGEPFTCVLRTDADAVLEWSEMAAAADDTDLSTAAGAAFIARFFRLMMAAPVYAAFRAHLKAHRTDPDVLTEIMQAVNEDMEKAVSEAAAGRPTRPSPRSSPGRGAKDERTLQIISLQEGDYEFTDPPGVSRQRRRANQRRSQHRRRAG